MVSAAPLPFRERDDDLSPDEVGRRYRTLIEQLPLVVYVDAARLDQLEHLHEPPDRAAPRLQRRGMGDRPRPVHAAAPPGRPRARARRPCAHARDARAAQHRVPPHRPRRPGRPAPRRRASSSSTTHGQPLYLQGYLLDITREREAEQQLRQLALYDPLTGLANRAFFHERLRHAIKLRHDEGQATGLLYIDLDDFKGINDRWGHDLGDEVLHEIGKRIEQLGPPRRHGRSPRRRRVRRRPDGAASRPSDAVGVAERLLTEIGRPLESGSGPLYTGASIGIAFGNDDETLLKEADIAMYRAKSTSRDRLRVLRPAARPRRRRAVAADRRAARGHRPRGVPARLPGRRRPRPQPRSWATRRSSAGSIRPPASSRPASSSRSPRRRGSSSGSANGCSPRRARRRPASASLHGSPDADVGQRLGPPAPPSRLPAACQPRARLVGADSRACSRSS